MKTSSSPIQACLVMCVLGMAAKGDLCLDFEDLITKSTCFSHSVGSQAWQTQWCKENKERACQLFDLIDMIDSVPSFCLDLCYHHYLLPLSNPNSNLLPGNHNLLFFKFSIPSAKLSDHKPPPPSPLADYPLPYLFCCFNTDNRALCNYSLANTLHSLKTHCQSVLPEKTPTN